MKIRPHQREGRTQFELVDLKTPEQYRAVVELLSTKASCTISEVINPIENAAGGGAARLALIRFKGRKLILQWDDSVGYWLRGNGNEVQAAAEEIAGFLAATDLSV